MRPQALNSPYELVVDRESGNSDGSGLPAEFCEVYGGDWVLPSAPGRIPYVYVNFVVSHDGRISFGEQGSASGAEVSASHPHDLWLMGLLRARADAVVIGDGIVRSEPDYDASAGFIFPGDARAFDELRRREGRPEKALTVVLSYDGSIPLGASILGSAGGDVLIATTNQGAGRCRELAASAQNDSIEVRTFGDESVDMRYLLETLRADYGAHSVLCEGGALVYGGMLAAGLVTDEFLTISPIVIGPGEENQRRPSLVDGTRFSSGDHPRSNLVSVRTVGDYLFLRSRYDVL